MTTLALAKCPCCGSPVANPNDIIVSLETNTISHNNVTARLTPQEAELAFILARGRPRAVARDTIINNLWGHYEDIDNPRKHISVRLVALRRKIAPLGIAITAIYGFGYRMDSRTAQDAYNKTAMEAAG